MSIQNQLSLEQKLLNDIGNCRPTIGDVLKECSKLIQADKRPEAIALVREFVADRHRKNSATVATFFLLIEATYHPLVKLALPDELPEKQPLPFGDENLTSSTTLHKALKMTPKFVEGCEGFIENRHKREALFISKIIDALSETDADLMSSLLRKEFNQKTFAGINQAFFRDALPDNPLWVHLDQNKATTE